MRAYSRASYRADRVAKELEQLLNEPRYREKAAAVGQIIQSEDGARTAADLIEGGLETDE